MPTYLTAVPRDPQDGAALRYQHVATGVVVYSLCEVNNSDRHVAYDPADPSPPGVGVAIHLYDVKYR